jgi:hypothetical protein
MTEIIGGIDRPRGPDGTQASANRIALIPKRHRDVGAGAQVSQKYF